MPTPRLGYKLANGKKVPSVTTVLSRFKDSGGLIHWAWDCGTKGLDYRQARDDAAESGTLAHAFVESYLKGLPKPKVDERVPEELVHAADVALDAFQRWHVGARLKIIATEVGLVSEAHKFGGTIDAVAETPEGELVICDWKSGNRIYADALVQVAAYRELWNENNQTRQAAPGGHIVRIGKDDGAFVHKHYPDLSDAWDLFAVYRGAYDMVKAIEKRAK